MSVCITRQELHKYVCNLLDKSYLNTSVYDLLGKIYISTSMLQCVTLISFCHNKRVDCLANTATVAGSRVTAQADILKAIRGTCQIKHVSINKSGRIM